MVVTKSRAWCKKEIWPFLDNYIGKDNLVKMIELDKPLFRPLLSNPNIPESWKEKIVQAPANAHYMKLLTEDDVYALLPDWVQPIVMSQPNGKEWFHRECETLKLLFGGL